MNRAFKRVWSVFQDWFGDSPAGKGQKRRSRPLLELLEDRCVPTVFVVNTALDVVAADGKVSLREAIQAANTNTAVNEAAAGSAGLDTIKFAAGLSGQTIRLSSELLITESLTINGLGASHLTISGDTNADGTGDTRLFNIDGAEGAVSVKITDLKLTKGNAATKGGAIASSFQNDDSLTILRCVLSNNTAGDEGGAVSVSASTVDQGSGGNLTIQDSTLSGNKSGQEGGAVYFSGDKLSINRCTIAGNSTSSEGGEQGAGLSMENGTGTIANSTFSGNTSGGEAGAIFLSFGDLTVKNSTISGNTAAGDGGGLYNQGGTLTVVNCTITQNKAGEEGGGVYATGGTTNLRNTIVEGNFANGVKNDLKRGGGGDGAIINAQFCLIQTPSDAINGINQNNIFGKSANLGPLQNNGGPTKTHALLFGSPAINHGNNAFATSEGLTTDQRGGEKDANGNLKFPRIVGGTVDIGAFEFHPGGRRHTQGHP